MPDVIAAATLANGLRADFEDTYRAVKNRQADSRLSWVVDLSVPATNREHSFAFHEAAPHAEHWARGGPIPQGAFGSIQFPARVHNFGKRIKWHKDDRADQQVGDLYNQAQQLGESFALNPERHLFDVLLNTVGLLPEIPLAPDGAALYSATRGNGQDRFEVTGGNLVTGTGVASTGAILTDYYNAIQRFKLMKDGQGQPLWQPDIIDQGVVIMFASENLKVFEEAFFQQRQVDATGATPTNIIQDARRNVSMWDSSRLSGDDWFVFLKGAPRPPMFELMRKSPIAFDALEGNNNSDDNRTDGTEYVQFESRSGMAISEPYSTVKVNN